MDEQQVMRAHLGKVPEPARCVEAITFTAYDKPLGTFTVCAADVETLERIWAKLWPDFPQRRLNHAGVQRVGIFATGDVVECGEVPA